jgi:protein gp37
MGWEPWTGCYKESDGCTYCYYYGPYSKRCGQNTIVRADDHEFYKPLETIYMPRKKITKYKIESGKNVGVCFTTDFFIKEADEWRIEAWSMMKQRPDLSFMFLTKRIDRFNVSLPDDWGDGYDNVAIGCTVENQEIADYRLPLFSSYPIKHRFIACGPILGAIDLSPYLKGVNSVTVGGESSRDARECHYDWVLSIKSQCEAVGVPFAFRSTGSRFVKDGVLHKINPKMQHRTAREMNINTDIDSEEEAVT